jgi:hypothetical protein
MDNDNRIDEIERLRNAYETISSRTSKNVSDIADKIKAYNKWHLAAVAFFDQYYDDSDVDYQKFKNTSSSDYRQISSPYHILLDRIQNGRVKNTDDFKQKSTDRPSIGFNKYK